VDLPLRCPERATTWALRVSTGSSMRSPPMRFPAADTVYQGHGPTAAVPQRRRQQDQDTGSYRPPLSEPEGRQRCSLTSAAAQVDGSTPNLRTGESCARSVPVRRPPPRRSIRSAEA
jgi:hypothetical protein